MITDEKTGIIYKKWECASPNAVFLLVHGLGGFSGRWDFLADFFLQNNISSYAIELKGFGQTQGIKGHVDSFGTYLKDIHSLLDAIKKENPGKKIFLIGESMGALLSFLFVSQWQDLLSGIVLISPVFKSRLKFSFFDYVKIAVFAVFNPKKLIKIPFDSSMCTRDADYQKVMDRDKREFRFASVGLLLNIAFAQIRVNFSKDKIKIPALFLVSGELDQIADSSVMVKVFTGLKTKDKEIFEYPEMCHALSIDSGREKVFSDILKWVSGRI